MAHGQGGGLHDLQAGGGGAPGYLHGQLQALLHGLLPGRLLGRAALGQAPGVHVGVEGVGVVVHGQHQQVLGLLGPLGGLQDGVLRLLALGAALGQVRHHGGQGGAQGPGQGGDGAAAGGRRIAAHFLDEVHAHHGHQAAHLRQAEHLLLHLEGRHVGQAHGEHGVLQHIGHRHEGRLALLAEVELAGLVEGLEGHEAHDLAARHHEPAVGGHLAGDLQDRVGGGDLVVGEVDGELGALVGVHVPADGLALGEEAGLVGLLADHALGRVDVVELQQVAQLVAVGLLAVRLQGLEGGGVMAAVPAGEAPFGVLQLLAAAVEGAGLAAPGHAALLPELEGDVRGVGLVPGVQGDVVGDEELARTGDQGAEGGHVARRAEVRRPLGILELLLEALVLPLADHRQVAPLRAAGGVLVQVDGNAQLLAHALAQAPRQLRAVLQGHALHRDEGTHIAGAHAGVRPGVAAHVDHLGGLLHRPEGRLHHAVRIAHEGHHRAVRVRARIHVQQLHPGHRLHGVRDDLDLGHIPAFGKVGHALHDTQRHEDTSQDPMEPSPAWG